MKTTPYFALFICFFAIINFSYSQQTNNLDHSYKEYFSLEREIPYLHLNKTSFIIGEELWFKTYIYNLNKKTLNNNTSNLYVALYDKKGSLKEKKLVFIENGIGAGSFKVDSTFTENEYYIKANTSWMKNFKEDESYFQKINIIQGKLKKNKEATNTYDIQFLPESGHLVASIKNTIGVVIKDVNNNGVKMTEGKIFNNQKKLITLFKTNTVGLGSFDFIYEKNQNYTAELTFSNGLKLVKKIPVAESQGVALSIFNPNTFFVRVSIKTNNHTLTKLIGKEYTLFIYNTTKSLKQRFTFTTDVIEYNLNLSSKNLENGINIATILDEKNNPVAERLFFNYNKKMFNKPLISVTKNDSDSTSISISKKNMEKEETYYLSASILPSTTKSYNPNSTIVSKFLLEPYINGKIENPNYYFIDINRKKLMNLDLLLLTQGWSKYKWANIYNNPPKEAFKNEMGITIDGFVNANKNTNEVFLMSAENDLMVTIPLKNNKFNLKHLFLKENSKISLSTKKGNKMKYDKFHLQFTPTKINDSIKIDTTRNVFDIADQAINYVDFISKGIELKEVIIKSKTKKNQNSPPILGASKSIKIDESFHQNLPVLQYLRTLGFQVNIGINGNHSIWIGRNSISLLLPKPVQVFLDNRVIQDENSNSLIAIDLLTLESLKEITVSKTGFGVIQLFTKPNFNKKNSKKVFSEKTVPFGYSEEKEYYQPLYQSYSNDFYKNHGAIHWNSKIKIDGKETKTSYNFLDLNQKEVRVFIEGITSEGAIILEEKIIELK